MSLSIHPISSIIGMDNNHQGKSPHPKNNTKNYHPNTGMHINEYAISPYVYMPVSIVIDPFIQQTREHMNKLLGIIHYMNYNK